jgi:formate-dependent phosphoribosylglycinamide formyltransferase (GAR transformylase)
MKRVLDAAGVRTPHHFAATTVAGVWEAAERIGYPIIVKPISGAGSADTYRADSAAQLAEVLPMLGHVPEVSVEEFVDGEELTFDTVCANGEILFENVMWYRPRPLQNRLHEWISPVSIVLRDLSVPELQAGRAMGEQVLAALGFRAGFTHMEWYRTASGEAVFGEIAARPPGARVVDLMNYACDADLYAGWAEAVLHGRIGQTPTRRYNAGSIFKRAQGTGRITHVEGLDVLRAAYRDDVVLVDLLPVGTERRDWRASVVGDGWVVVRHRALGRVIEMTERFSSDLHLYAG